MSRHRVVVTGTGLISPFGLGAGKMFDGLYAGRSAVVNIKEWLGPRASAFHSLVAAPLAENPEPRDVPRTFRRNMGPLAILAHRSCVDAVASAAVPAAAVGSPGFGIVYSSTTGSAEALEESFRTYLEGIPGGAPNSGSFFKTMSHTCTANVAHALGLRGIAYSVSSACASSTQAIGIAADLLRRGAQEMILCGGSEELHPLSVQIFDLLQAASWKYNDRPSATPRPFDLHRDGTVCGAGAGALLLETEESALRRGAPILGEIAGYATNIDPTSMAQSSRDSIVACMREALADAGVRPEEIDYVNAHATATLAGDIAEAAAIAEVFGGRPVPVSSLKGHMGHTLAASGVLELAACLEMMRCGRLIPSLNLEEPCPEAAGLNHVPPQGMEAPVRCLVKNSFAFGGINAVLVVKEYSA
jgi:3-oxoacyl-[acyl-carrier-protein] synthase II